MDHAAANSQMEDKLATATADLKKVGLTRTRPRKSRSTPWRDENPDRFHGEIRWVNQRGGIVWLNLGRVDALRPQTTFSVYSAGTNDMSEIGKKASIEVTQILGSHLAQARILKDDATDPILPGDKIYTPVWSLGEKRHFAIAGMIDLNRDGHCDPSELQRLHTLIELNGGVVDSPMDAKGKRHGEMTTDTRYLILGGEPDMAAVEQQQDFSDMNKKAKTLRVEQITLEKFLDRMGWKRQSEMVAFGGGDGATIPVSPDESPRVSGGKISDLFKPRRPPRSSGGSAY